MAKKKIFLIEILYQSSSPWGKMISEIVRSKKDELTVLKAVLKKRKIKKKDVGFVDIQEIKL